MDACSSSNPGGASANGGSPSAPGTTATVANTPGQPGQAAQSSFSVTGVDISVNPANLSGYACGTQLTVTYTATFHFPAQSPGGKVTFQYTTDNGRGSTPTELTAAPGTTSLPYQFAWSGQLPSDHTQPGPGGVIVSAPNTLTSQLVGPSGACSTPAPAAFKVTSIELSAGPSLTGHTCGTNFTEIYTAIFHIAPNGPGGTIAFQSTTDNGHSGTNATLQVAAGQTSVTYQFKWVGTLPPDHTQPGVGIVLMTAPNAGQSPSVAPNGQCS